MSYTITLTSSNEYVNDTDYLTLVLVFTVNDSGSNESYSFSTKKIIVKEWGNFNTRYELDDHYVRHGTMQLKLGDADNYLQGLLYDDTTVSKHVQVQLKLTTAQPQRQEHE